MSTKTLAPAPKPSESPEESTIGRSAAGRSLMPVVTAAIGLLLVAAFIGMFIAARSGDRPSATLESRAEAAGETTGEAGGSATPAAVAVTAEEAVAEFTAAWSIGDFDTMAAVASDAAIQTARDFHVDGGTVEPVGATSATTGELLYADPAGGNALIFRYTIGVDENGSALITDLTFGGDAG